MKYLLDTCILSYFVRGEKNVLNRIKTSLPRDLCISSITLMEIEYGLLLNPPRAKKLKPVIESFIENINILQFDEKDAICAASVRAALQKKGKSIGAYDILLAGCALHHGLIFVTANIKEFERVSGLLIENWLFESLN